MKKMMYLIFILPLLLMAQHNKQDIEIGRDYRVCNYARTPFEEDTYFTITVLDYKRGWVKYCHNEEKYKKDPLYFTRKTGEFLEIINWCYTKKPKFIDQ